MPHTWTRALGAYRYPVHLRTFADTSALPGWFRLNLSRGDVGDTIRFERHFREHGGQSIEAWYEVVFWKMFSQGGRRDIVTRQVIQQLTDGSVTARRLWDACHRYVRVPSRRSFDSFRRLLGFKTPAIAIVATFPAFMSPDQYPMVDRRVAEWVDRHHSIHNAADPSGPQLRSFARGPLTMRHYPSMQAWVRWCRHTAGKLSTRTGQVWRARDIEMAVFQAWGGRGSHPRLPLNPLSP